MKTIVFTGGGTAGHVYPNIALIEQLQDYDIHYIGTDGMEKQILSGQKNVKYHQISAVKFDRSNILKNLFVPIKLLKSIRQAKRILKQIKPDIIFSKGGYVSLPVVLAAKNINIITHESDLSLGLANKIIAKKAKVVCTTFQQTAACHKNFIYTGQPIRKQIFEGNKNTVFKKIGNQNKPIILFVGGSLGSQKINSLLSDASFLTKDFVVIIAVGKNNFSKVKPQNGCFVFDYLNPIADFYDAADLVVSRAGSGVINELLALNKPMLLLPLAKGASRGDQIENAKIFKQNGFAEAIFDEDLSKQSLLNNINKIMKNANFYKKNMQKCNILNANKQIIDLIKKFS